LASDLGLSKGTVERAYELLEADGVVESRGRAGTFVRVRPTGRGSTVLDLTDLHEAADALAVITRQFGVEDAAAQDALARALERLR
jgi:DNA-binding GntR family transcriptional regulator